MELAVVARDLALSGILVVLVAAAFRARSTRRSGLFGVDSLLLILVVLVILIVLFVSDGSGLLVLSLQQTVYTRTRMLTSPPSRSSVRLGPRVRCMRCV